MQGLEMALCYPQETQECARACAVTHPVLQQIRIVHVHSPLIPEGELRQVEADAAANHLHTSHWDSCDALHAFLAQAHSAGVHDDLVDSSMLLHACCCCLLSMCISAARLSMDCLSERLQLLIDTCTYQPSAEYAMVRSRGLGDRQ